MELRTAGDAERLKNALRAGRRLAIVGGGYIGLEVAASARALEAEVTVIERDLRSEEHTSELQSLMRISYAVFCLNKKTNTNETKQKKKQLKRQHRQFNIVSTKSVQHDA